MSFNVGVKHHPDIFLIFSLVVLNTHVVLAKHNPLTIDPQAILEGLAVKNHAIEVLKSMGAVVQAVVRYSAGLSAESDPRKGGYAAGY